MPIYEFGKEAIRLVPETAFHLVGLHERRDLQRLLREHVDVISPDTLVIAEEFGDWNESRRRIDLLGIDKSANLVVIELKRTEDGGHMELQAIRYAAMVANMTFDQAVEALSRYLIALNKKGQEARELLLDFLGWETVDEEQFGQEVRIVLASAEFSKELTSSVLWLNKHDLDIRCVRLKPYQLDGHVLVDAQQIIPLPEAEAYQIQVREKFRKERETRAGGIDFTRFDVEIEGSTYPAEWKRNAILLVCKRLCDADTAPDAISALFAWRSNRVWYIVDATVEKIDFVKLATEKAATNEARFDSRRWFIEDDELIHVGGKTYALSNQWGGDGWYRAMSLLKDRFPEFGIKFSPVT